MSPELAFPMGRRQVVGLAFLDRHYGMSNAIGAGLVGLFGQAHCTIVGTQSDISS
jgi:hypothetical protein